MKIFSSYLSISLVLVISCSSMHSGLFSKKQLAKLNGSWELIELLGNSNFDTIYVEQNPFIKLSLEEGRIKGNSGCNSFSGKFEVTNSSIAFGEFLSTKMFCMHVPESEFFDALEEVNSYKLNGNQLELVAEDKALMKFQKMKD